MSNNIQTLHTSFLSAEDTLIITKRSQQTIGTQFSEDVKISQMLADVNAKAGKLQEAIDRVPGSAFTCSMAEADMGRIQALNALRFWALFHAHYDGASKEVNQAAKKVLKAIKRLCRKIYRLGYTGKSVRFNSLINEFRTDEMAAALKQFQAEDKVDYLEKTHKAFEALYQEKVDNETNNGVLQKQEAKGIVERYLSILLFTIDYHAEKNGAPYDSLVEKLNEIIEDITAQARARKTRENNTNNNDDVTSTNADQNIVNEQ